MIAIRFPFEITRELTIESIVVLLQKHILNEQPTGTLMFQISWKNMEIQILI